MLKLLPKSGLVVDIRSNPGGCSSIASVLWSSIFSAPLPSYQLVLRASPFMNDTFVDPDGELNKFLLAGSELTGPGRDLTNTSGEYKKVFEGQKVILVVDSITASGDDLFTSFFSDVGTGENKFVVGLDSSTNGAGATVISFSDFQGFRASDEQFHDIVSGTDFFSAFGRFFRGGKNAEKLIEHLGVPVDFKYYITRNDLLNNNEDLMNDLGKVFHSMEQV